MLSAARASGSSVSTQTVSQPPLPALSASARAENRFGTRPRLAKGEISRGTVSGSAAARMVNAKTRGAFGRAGGDAGCCGWEGSDGPEDGSASLEEGAAKFKKGDMTRPGRQRFKNRRRSVHDRYVPADNHSRAGKPYADAHDPGGGIGASSASGLGFGHNAADGIRRSQGGQCTNLHITCPHASGQAQSGSNATSHRARQNWQSPPLPPTRSRWCAGVQWSSGC